MHFAPWGFARPVVFTYSKGRANYVLFDVTYYN